jgi:hypothetical protein
MSYSNNLDSDSENAGYPNRNIPNSIKMIFFMPMTAFRCFVHYIPDIIPSIMDVQDKLNLMKRNGKSKNLFRSRIVLNYDYTINLLWIIVNISPVPISCLIPLDKQSNISILIPIDFKRPDEPEIR